MSTAYPLSTRNQHPFVFVSFSPNLLEIYLVFFLVTFSYNIQCVKEAKVLNSVKNK